MIEAISEKGLKLLAQTFTRHRDYITKDSKNICIKEYNKKGKYQILGKWI